jgi:hypothetical protein
LTLALSACSSSSDKGTRPSDPKGNGSADAVTLTAKCTPDSLVPVAPATSGVACSSYVTPTSDGVGDLVELGPYGAIMEPNLGADFAITPSPQESTCDMVAAGFGEDPKLTAEVLDLRGSDLSLYTVFRPAKWVDGQKYPIVTWGNGTCAQPGAYAALLLHVASQGIVVVAANGRWVANGAMVKALDFIFAANEDAASPYYHRLDTTKVGAMGHSQGSAATVVAATDARVNAAILFNGGTVPASKPFLAVSGDRDIGAPTADGYRNVVTAAPEASFIFYHKVPMTGGKITGHLTLMMQPSRVVDATSGWWNYILKSDDKARALFVGDACGLCGKDDDFQYGQHGLP